MKSRINSETPALEPETLQLNPTGNSFMGEKSVEKEREQFRLKAVSLTTSSVALLLEEAAETAAAALVAAAVGIGLMMLLFLLVLLVLILQDTADNGAANGSENTMIRLVAGETACDTSGDGTT